MLLAIAIVYMLYYPGYINSLSDNAPYTYFCGLFFSVTPDDFILVKGRALALNELIYSLEIYWRNFRYFATTKSLKEAKTVYGIAKLNIMSTRQNKVFCTNILSRTEVFVTFNFLYTDLRQRRSSSIMSVFLV